MAIINGTAGADSLVGTSGDDVINGLAGNDTMSGGAGSDVYNYAVGDGVDRIIENNTGAGVDRLVLGTGLNSSDLVITRTDTTTLFMRDAVLSFTGQSGSLTLVNTFQNGSGGYGIEEIEFGNGEVWTQAQLKEAYLAQVQTAGNDTIMGFEGDTTFNIAAIAGADTITDASGFDRVVLGAGLTSDLLTLTRTGDLDARNSAILSFAGQSGSLTLRDVFDNPSLDVDVEEVEFGNGEVWTRAQLKTAYLERSQTAGNDTISGFRGDTVFTVDLLAGNDVFDEYGSSSGDVDRLVLGAAYTADTLVQRTDVNMTLSFVGHSGSLAIVDQFAGDGRGFEEIEFGDGTVWTKAQLHDFFTQFVGTAASDALNGQPGTASEVWASAATTP